MPYYLKANIISAYSLIILAGLSSGCAGLYRPVEVNKHDTFSQVKGEDISYKYDLDIMMEAKNRRYANKASRVGVELVLLDIQNHTNDTISISQLQFFLDDTNYEPLDSGQVKNSLRQIPLGYVAYSLVYPSALNYFPVGLPITIANVAVAINSNHRFRKNLYEYYIKEKDIPPGQKVRGFLGFYTTNDVYRPEKLRIEQIPQKKE